LQGVSDEDARRAPTVSSLSLLSLVKHSAIWERRWFQVVVAGRSFAGEWPEVQPQDENVFRLTDDDTVETVVAYYREQIAASQEIVRTVDLDAPCAWPEMRSEEHTSELQSRFDLVCRLLLEKKKTLTTARAHFMNGSSTAPDDRRAGISQPYLFTFFSSPNLLLPAVVDR